MPFEIPYDLPYIWNLKKNDSNELTKQKETHRLRKQTSRCQGGGIAREFGKVLYTLLYSNWITNKDLVYSTWNSSQCSVPAWMEEGFGDTCVCMAESLCCSPETTTTLLTGYASMQNKKFIV